MEEPNVDVKKEVILSRLDYAISCVRELEEMDRTHMVSSTSWANMAQLLKDIEIMVKEY